MPESHSRSREVGGRKFKMQERFSTSSLGGVVRDISFSSDGSLVSCVGTNGLCVIFSLETLEDLTALDEVRAAVVARSLDGKSDRAKIFNYSLNDVSELAVARQFTEHTQSVEVMRFHPTRPLILSGGHDGDVYIRDFSQPDTKILWHIHDTFPIRSAAFHPTGEYVLVGTDHVVPRLINIQTGVTLTTPDALVSGNEEGHMKHAGGITSVGFSCDGRTLCTTSLDGSWILYDGVSGKAVHRVSDAHSSVPVTSVNYSRSGQILLTCGMDSTAKLWDLRRLASGSSTNKGTADVAAFGEPGKCNHRSIHAVFSHDESHVLMQDTSLLAIRAYSVFSEDASYTLTTEPPVIQRSIAVSPFSNVVVTGGDDSRLRVWTPSWLPS
ncbi:cleavage stimulation factor subunit 1 [Strigomonas culicis]|nr:cleavage stimulation factor subunit 1 [Strigomonas culicis]|eukprot:EPY31737.1 cleavage stimulation factor subunit 1 [Strigomonas culicis]